MPTGVAVRARGWGWRHAGRARPAVSGLDLEIGESERVLLLGPSGAGKSTLLHGIAGVLGGDDEGDATGTLTVDGQPPEAARGRVGLVQQDPDAQIVLARIGDDVAFGCENLAVPREEIWPRVHEALDDVGLRLPLDAATASLSGGQKQRLALAGVLAMRPGLILLDEPTANLDPDGVAEVRDAVARVAQRTGATLVIVEHRVAVWADLVDRVIVLAAGGGVAADGSPDAVLSHRGGELAAAGVWVLGYPPAVPSRTRTDGGLLLETEHLAVGRKPFGAKLAVLAASEIELQCQAGRMLALTGPNGAGKTTTALTVAGLLPPVHGSVRASPELAGGLGPDPHRWRSRELVARIGTVFQEPEHQFLTARVRDELAVGPRRLRLPSSELAARVDELLDRLRLGALADANPFTLSGGEKRRLSVATVLASRPRLLVLDEPTFGQDARTWAELAALTAELLNDGHGVVAVTHDLAFADALADTTARFAAARERVPS